MKNVRFEGSKTAIPPDRSPKSYTFDKKKNKHKKTWHKDTILLGPLEQNAHFPKKIKPQKRDFFDHFYDT